MKAIICDIDGTLAVKNNREFYEYSKADTDLPNIPIIYLVKLLHKAGHDFIFVSGREETCRELTEKWIKKHTGIRKFNLFMRKTKDYREDSIIKLEIYETYLKNYSIYLVIDDRDRVVRMWRGLGLTCLQVAEGDF